MKKAEDSRKEYEKNNPKQQAAEEKKEEKKVLKYERVLEFSNALNFSNGVTVTSLQELLDVMPNIAGPTFKHHVTSEKNDIADWVQKNFNDQELADKLRAAKNHEEYIKIIEEDKLKNNKPVSTSSTSTESDKKTETTTTTMTAASTTAAVNSANNEIKDVKDAKESKETTAINTSNLNGDEESANWDELKRNLLDCQMKIKLRYWKNRERSIQMI